MITSDSVQAAFHYLYPSELPALKALAISLPENPLVINIGAGAGTSGLAFIESRPDLSLVTIDIQDESSPYGCLEAERDVVERAGYSSIRERRWWQVRGRSQLVGVAWQSTQIHVEYLGATFKPRPVDMVFIDGDHSYEGCKGDIDAWLPNIRPGGVMVVHDYLKANLAPDPNGPHPMPWPEVDRAVSELLVPRFHMLMHVASLVAFQVNLEQT